MIVKLHKGQLEVARDEHRFRVLDAGRRWGKSVLCRMIMYKWALEKPGLYWIVSPTFQQGKDIHWLQGFKQEIQNEHLKKWNDAELSVYLTNGSIIQLKSTEHPDRLKGVKLRGLVVDEIAAMRNWDWIWEDALRPTLTDYQAPALFISTPKGLNHFYRLAKMGDHTKAIPGNAFHQDGTVVTPNEDYMTYRFTSYDNPFVPDADIDKAKATLNEDYFAQNYLADFRKYTGVVYKDFDRKINVIPSFAIPEEWERYRAMDFGSDHPLVCLWIAVSPKGDWYVYDEHYEVNLSIDYHAGLINAKTGFDKIEATWGDPSGKVWREEFARQPRNIYITSANRETGTSLSKWVTYGIDRVAEKLVRKLGRDLPFEGYQRSEKGIPSLFIFSHCTKTVNAFETYRWKERKDKSDIKSPEQPEKVDDDCMDALRYFAVSYNRQEAYKLPKDDVSLKNWSLV